MGRRFLYPSIKKNGNIAANPNGFWGNFVKRRGANPDKIRVGSNEDLGSLVTTLVPIRCYGHHGLAVRQGLKTIAKQLEYIPQGQWMGTRLLRDE
jgi:hypothetical protein